MWLRRTLFLSVVTVLFVGTAAVTATVASPDADPTTYEQNSSGRSYGTLPTAGVPDPREFPDLIAVTGEDGVEGYAYATDLFGNQPEPLTPEQALSQNSLSHYVPVYASDGETILGRFRVSGVEDDGLSIGQNDPRS